MYQNDYDAPGDRAANASSSSSKNLAAREVVLQSKICEYVFPTRETQPQPFTHVPKEFSVPEMLSQKLIRIYVSPFRDSQVTG